MGRERIKQVWWVFWERKGKDGNFFYILGMKNGDEIGE